MNRKLERSQKIEEAGNTDEVLLEEIREYKVIPHCALPLHHDHPTMTTTARQTIPGTPYRQ